MTLREGFALITPPWLNGPTGFRLLYAFGVILDATKMKMEYGIKVRFPNVYGEESLPAIGDDRLIDRGPTEPAANYAGRLSGAFDTWRSAGNALTLLDNLAAFFDPHPVNLRLVDERGYWHERDKATGVVTRTRPQAFPAPTFDAIAPTHGDASTSPVTVTVNGRYFASGLVASLVPYIPLTNIVVAADGRSFTGQVPVGTPAGAYELDIQSIGGTISIPNAFTSDANAIVVSGISTSGGAVGDIDGGYPAALTGTFPASGSFQVYFGTTAATAASTSSTAATVTVPGHAAGVVTVSGTSGGTGPSFEFWSPASLALSEWHRDYNGLPWASGASAGDSAGRSAVTNAADPTTGASVNGKTPAAFVPSHNMMIMGATNQVLFSTTGGTFFALVNPSSLPALSGTVYQNGQLATDSSAGETCFGMTTSGLHGTVYSSGYRVVQGDVPTVGAWSLAQFKWDGTSLKCRLNGGAWTSTPCPPLTLSTASAPILGRSYAATSLLAGSVLEAATAASSVTDADFDKLRSYMNTRYFPAGAQV